MTIIIYLRKFTDFSFFFSGGYLGINNFFFEKSIKIFPLKKETVLVEEKKTAEEIDSSYNTDQASQRLELPNENAAQITENDSFKNLRTSDQTGVTQNIIQEHTQYVGVNPNVEYLKPSLNPSYPLDNPLVPSSIVLTGFVWFFFSNLFSRQKETFETERYQRHGKIDNK